MPPAVGSKPCVARASVAPTESTRRCWPPSSMCVAAVVVSGQWRPTVAVGLPADRQYSSMMHQQQCTSDGHDLFDHGHDASAPASLVELRQQPGACDLKRQSKVATGAQPPAGTSLISINLHLLCLTCPCRPEHSYGVE